MRIGSLFAGIGGLELGLERAGVGHTVWQVEKDPFCRQVLAKHWPDATRYEDVTTTDWTAVEPVDVLCGGFPCQDISSAGGRAGIDDGSRSSLWGAYLDAIRVLRPRFVVVENVADILVRGFGRVADDLAGAGYSFEWAVIPAAAVGAPQRRSRVFVVADLYGGRLEGLEERDGGWQRAFGRSHADGLALAQHRAAEAASRVHGMDDGVPRRVDRLRALGNAVVPQVAEVVGRRLLELDGAA